MEEDYTLIEKHEKKEDVIYEKVVPDDKKRTSNSATAFEIANALSHRIAQIERGSPVFVDIDGLDSPYQIAIKELVDKKTPLILERRIETPNGIEIEKFKLRNMDISKFIKDLRVMPASQIKKYIHK